MMPFVNAFYVKIIVLWLSNSAPETTFAASVLHECMNGTTQCRHRLASRRENLRNAFVMEFLNLLVENVNIVIPSILKSLAIDFLINM